MISYKKLLKTLIDKNLKKTDLQKLISCSSTTLAKINNNKNISLDVINKICKELNCGIEDVIEYVD